MDVFYIITLESGGNKVTVHGEYQEGETGGVRFKYIRNHAMRVTDDKYTEGTTAVIFYYVEETTLEDQCGVPFRDGSDYFCTLNEGHEGPHAVRPEAPE